MVSKLEVLFFSLLLFGLFWRWRNQFIFETETWVTSKVLCSIAAMARDLSTIDLLDMVEEAVMNSSWQVPPHEFFKINVDGSVLWSLNRGGYGVITRGHHSAWVAGLLGMILS